jgi:hypothetical protein
MRLHAPAGIELPASPRLLDATAIDEIAVGQEGFGQTAAIVKFASQPILQPSLLRSDDVKARNSRLNSKI